MSRWHALFEGFDSATEGQREALCTLANGYMATRGAVPEATLEAPFYPATYIAGVLNRPMTEPPSDETETETIVNLPNWLYFRFRLESQDWVDSRSPELVEHHHELDFRNGLLVRHLRFEDPEGRATRVTQRRFVSIADPHVAAIESTFLAENWDGPIVVESGIDGRIANRNVGRYASFEAEHFVPVARSIEGELTELVIDTAQSHIRVAEVVRTRVFRAGDALKMARTPSVADRFVAETFSIPMKAGVPVTVEKVVAIYTSKDRAIDEPAHAARRWAARASDFGELFSRHRLGWSQLWRRARIEIVNDDETSRILNLHLFHLLQTVSENTAQLDVGVPARGLHGEGYRGHIFWDELLIFPFLNLRFPELTRSLLLYRHRRLPEARWAAVEAGFRGAMFPWRSGSDGRDETPRLLFNPLSGRWISDNSHLQRHVGIAIAYNVWLYYQVTADMEFMVSFGAELIVEVARFFASMAEYDSSRDRYEIRGVMGPDEYHDGYPDRPGFGLANNAYTNVMTSWLLVRAIDALNVLRPDARDRLVERLDIRAEEFALWEEISRKLYVHMSDDGVIWQFEGYECLEELDWEAYRQRYGNIQRLDLILEAEGGSPNRYKLSKQPDVLMLFYLLSADELREIFGRLGYDFAHDTIPRNIAYYGARTAHGSTLSRVIMAWVLSRANRMGSWELFQGALASDVADAQVGTTREGIHLGAMAGTVDLVQRCYAGIETHHDVLWLGPLLPAELQAIRFDVHYRGHWIEIDVLPERVRVYTRPTPAAAIRVGYKTEVVTLAAGQTHQFEVVRAAETPTVADNLPPATDNLGLR